MPGKRNALTIKGYHHEAVPHTFFRQEQETYHAALVLPGIGYSCQQSVLYYPTLELVAHGADVLWVEYNQRATFSTLNQHDAVECALSDAVTSYRTLLQQRPYTKITFVGKSLGTFVMAQMLQKEQLVEGTNAIWLTPVIGPPELRQPLKVAAQGRRSLFVIGTKDYHYSPEAVEDVQESTQSTFLIIEDADHSMEIVGNTLRSIEAQTHTIQAIKQFLS